MVIGSDILFYIRKEEISIESLYYKIKNNISIDLDLFYDTLTYLWLIDSITISNNKVFKKEDVLK